MLVRPLGGKDPQRRAWQPTPIFLPGESHGLQYSCLVGYSLQGCKELDRLKRPSNSNRVDLQCCVPLHCMQSNSVTHTHVSILFHSLYSHRLRRALNGVPRPIQQAPMDCLFYIEQCVYINPNFLIYHPPAHISLLITISLFSKSVCLFSFCK